MSIRKWTEERVNQLRKLISDGLIYREIAEALGTTKGAVKHIVRERNLPHPRNARRWTNDNIDKVKILRKEGKTRDQIAAIFGVSKDAIKEIIRKYNLPKKQIPRNIDPVVLKAYFREALTNKEIGGILHISPGSVSHLARRLGVSRTKDERVRSYRRRHRGWVAARRDVTIKNLKKRLSPVRHSYNIGYLLGAFRGTDKCKCKSRLHYYTISILLIQRVSNILSQVINRRVKYYRKVASYKDKYHTFAISVYCRELVTYLSQFIKTSERDFPESFLALVQAGVMRKR